MNFHSHHHDAPLDHLDTTLISSEKGIYALKLSFIGLLITAIFQGILVWYSHSAALLGDTLHNCADAFTALPLWVAFALNRRKPSARFTYGYSRFEDLAGIFIILLIIGTGILVGLESYEKFKLSEAPRHLNWVIFGSIVGFFGNMWVARLRIRVGKEIHSAALVADGQHAKADAYTSIGVLVGAIGVYLGFPRADALIGFVISFFILEIGWSSGKELVARLADAVSPELIEKIKKEASVVHGVLNIHDIRARYTGHSLRLEMTIEVDGSLSVVKGHEIAIEVQHVLQHQFPILVSPTIHVDPKGHPGEAHHFAHHHQHQK